MSKLPEKNDQATLPFLRINHRPPKPRTSGLTEIRGPYYSPMGKRYLQDVLETCAAHRLLSLCFVTNLNLVS